MPWLNQLVTMCRLTPAPSSSSPSLDVMPRAQDEILAAGADQGPDHRHRGARQGRAADADERAVGNQGRRLFERHDLVAQAAVALPGAAAQLGVARYQQPCSILALNSAINSSQADAAWRISRQKAWLRRRSKASSETLCCSTQV